MDKRHAVTVMISDAQLAQIAYEQGNMVKAAYWYGNFLGMNELVEYNDIVEHSTPEERKYMVDTISNLTDIILEAIK